MTNVFKLAAPAMLLALGACTTGFRADVARFQAMPAPQGQSFVVVASDPDRTNSLEFAQYANLVAQRLQGFGYVRSADSASANLVVALDYDVDRGRERVRSTGGFGGGYGGFGYGGGFGRFGYGGYPYYGFGRRSFVYGFHDPFLFGGGYNDVTSYTVYASQLEMTIERRGSRERVFEGTAKAQSTNDELTRLVPNLIEAMFTGFPGNSGETVNITVAPPERRRG